MLSSAVLLAASEGTSLSDVTGRCDRKPSYEAKKKKRSRWMGPPKVPPNSCVACLGFASARLLANQSLALSPWLLKSSKTEP